MTYSNKRVPFEMTISGLRSHAYELASSTVGVKHPKEVLEVAKRLYEWLVEMPEEEPDADTH